LITNEGLTFRRYTLNQNDPDAGGYIKNPPAGQYQVRINMGGLPTAPNPGNAMNNSITDLTGSSDIRAAGTLPYNNPRVFGNYLVMTAFRVRVTGNVGDTIVLGAGQIRFKKTNLAGDPDTVLNAIPYKIRISQNVALCSDNTGSSILAEFGGTFGSGNTLNRPTGPTFPIPIYTYIPNMSAANNVGDGYYALVNNSSPKASTNINSRIQPNCSLPAGPIPVTDSCANRMFNGFWDINGDHTGTTTAAGNPPPANGVMGGYMLMVNADLATTEAYRQTISGLCPNTYYEFSAWVKNVCRTCAIDSNGTQMYKPGVLPNLTFTVNNLDRYSTGYLDTIGWQKKGFIFKTDTNQTNFTVSIRNNAPGGGGNDWLLDDISVATCTPQLNLTPNGNSNVCFGNPVTMNCTVRSYFNNYVYWEWEQSTNGGTTWTSTGVTGSSTPTLVSGAYQYTATYPTFLADSTTHNKMFRIKVASKALNLLTGNCSFAASNTLLVMVNSCSELLKVKMLSFDGSLVEDYAQLKWRIDNEQPNTIYEIERSDDKIHFARVGQVPGKAPSGFGTAYTFIDKSAVTSNAFYRLKIIEATTNNYSKIIFLNKNLTFGIKSLINPFHHNLSFDVITPEAGIMEVYLSDTYGRLIKNFTRSIEVGLNNINLDKLGGISQGTYTLRIQLGDRVINKRVIKISN
jgi:hypothetical protein